MKNPRVVGAAAIGALALIVSAVAFMFSAIVGQQGAAPVVTVVITLFPTPTRSEPTVTAQPAPTGTPEFGPVPATSSAPRSTAIPQTYKIQPDDTLWDISIKLDVSPDDLLLANPGLKPELLQIGATLNIPKGYDDTPRDLGSPPARGTPYVSIEADGLRLRREPAIGEEVLVRIPAYTALKVNRRSADQAWLNVSVDGKSGWVFGPYVQLNGVAADSIPGSAVAVARVAAPTVRAGTPVPPVSSGSNAASSLIAPTATRRPVIIPDDPYVSGISSRARQIFADGQARGNNRRVFSVIGDSNSENPKFLKYIDWGNYDVGNYEFLQETVEHFRGSFGRTSQAAFGGFGTEKMLAPNSGCGRSALECELSSHRPVVALILLGTGDQHSWQTFEGRYRKIIETTISFGVIPILQTKGDDLECRDNSAPCGTINGIIVKLAREYGVPLLDLRRAINNLPNRGMTADGFHFSFPPDDHPAHFGENYLAYGFNMRNLTALRALDAVRRQIIGG